MVTKCRKCEKQYDDALCWTFCPHERFISDEDAARKDLANSLIGKTLRFRYFAAGVEVRISAIRHNGMVEIKGMSGEFDPDILVVEEEWHG